MQPIGFGNLKKKFSSGVEFKNGIEFRDGKRFLHFMDQVVAEGVLPGEQEPREYFYNLRFLEDFPQIEHWAFGDAWTQRIKIGRPKRRDDELEGWVYFGDDDSRSLYIITRAYDPYPVRAVAPGEDFSYPPYVWAPLPPLFDVSLNFPLRLIVARAVLAALDDNWPYDQWQVVTSVVEREHVRDVIVPDVALAYGFRLRNTPLDLRQALCDFQGLRA
ncbi:MAG: hypothetical protein HRF47_09370 [Chloroflexota bacterium]|jgi:hypothetical protein